MIPCRLPSICYGRLATMTNILTMCYQLSYPFAFDMLSPPLPTYDMNMLWAPPCYQYAVYMLSCVIGTPVSDAICYALRRKLSICYGGPHPLICHQCATNSLAICYQHAMPSLPPYAINMLCTPLRNMPSLCDA